MPHVIQLIFDTNSGGVAGRLYVSQITSECDGHRISPQATQAQGVNLCSIEPGEIEIPRNVRKITTAVTAFNCDRHPPEIWCANSRKSNWMGKSDGKSSRCGGFAWTYQKRINVRLGRFSSNWI